MQLTIDTDQRSLQYYEGGQNRLLDLYSKEAFEILSRAWLVVGWNQKYTYTFTWFGRPIIQLPEDMVRLQEVIYNVRPDVIIETGVAHGGSLVFYASLCKALGHGRVIGIDIEIRPHNRSAIEAHDLAPLMTLVDGSSTDPAVVAQVRSLVMPRETVLVVLDSNHSKSHVAAELEAYAPFVTMGSYVVATDGIMQYLSDVPRGQPDWAWNNPTAAVAEFVARHPEFVCAAPPWSFNESDLGTSVTHWPDGWLKRVRS